MQGKTRAKPLFARAYAAIAVRQRCKETPGGVAHALDTRQRSA